MSFDDQSQSGPEQSHQLLQRLRQTILDMEHEGAQAKRY
jgi:hypothetical protein